MQSGPSFAANPDVVDEYVFERGERVASIFKLVDACHRCGLAFRVASDQIANAVFRHYADELRQMMDRFSFELLTEIRRIDGGDFGPARSYVEPVENPDALQGRCNAALRDVEETYEEILRDHLPAHARAMIKRQSQQFSQMISRFTDLGRELSA